MSRAERAAVAHYQRRSAAFFAELTEGSDIEDGTLTDDERARYEEAHRLLGSAIEGETFKPDEGPRHAKPGLAPPIPDLPSRTEP